MCGGLNSVSVYRRGRRFTAHPGWGRWIESITYGAKQQMQEQEHLGEANMRIRAQMAGDIGPSVNEGTWLDLDRLLVPQDTYGRRQEKKCLPGRCTS